MKYIDFDLIGDILLIAMAIALSVYFMGVSKVISYFLIIAYAIKIIGMKFKK
jgi:hypothetical protein